jgi:hypothetical protein
MIVWDIKKLESQLREGAVSDGACVLYLLLLLLPASIRLLQLYSMEYRATAWTKVSAFVFLTYTIAGALYSFARNGGTKGSSFLYRYIPTAMVVYVAAASVSEMRFDSTMLKSKWRSHLVPSQAFDSICYLNVNAAIDNWKHRRIAVRNVKLKIGSAGMQTVERTLSHIDTLRRLDSVTVDSAFAEIFASIKTRYFALLFQTGYGFSAENASQLAAQASAGGLLSFALLGSGIVGTIKPRSEMRFIMVDKLSGRVLYYAKENEESDPLLDTIVAKQFLDMREWF